jgi:hypothetical protein
MNPLTIGSISLGTPAAAHASVPRLKSCLSAARDKDQCLIAESHEESARLSRLTSLPVEARLRSVRLVRTNPSVTGIGIARCLGRNEGANLMNLGRDRLDWTPDVWKLIDTLHRGRRHDFCAQYARVRAHASWGLIITSAPALSCGAYGTADLAALRHGAPETPSRTPAPARSSPYRGRAWLRRVPPSQHTEPSGQAPAQLGLRCHALHLGLSRAANTCDEDNLRRAYRHRDERAFSLPGTMPHKTHAAVTFG